ncbi:hypothetical protein [Streptomyces sp. NPDC002788]
MSAAGPLVRPGVADQGLLEVVYERRSGLSGPGAGRPAKLYRRSDRQVSVGLPERHYKLSGRLPARAVEEADATGEPVRTVLHREATELGEELGAREAADVLDLLERHGFEPRREAGRCLKPWERDRRSGSGGWPSHAAA